MTTTAQRFTPQTLPPRRHAQPDGQEVARVGTTYPRDL